MHKWTLQNNFQKFTQKYKKEDSIKRYLTPEIKKPQNIKSKLLSKIHRSKKNILDINYINKFKKLF